MSNDFVTMLLLCGGLVAFGIVFLLLGTNRIRMPEKTMSPEERNRWTRRLRLVGWVAVAAGIVMAIALGVMRATRFI
jgi:uncharacterized protein YjeT (DUF2065 family)